MSAYGFWLIATSYIFFFLFFLPLYIVSFRSRVVPASFLATLSFLDFFWAEFGRDNLRISFSMHVWASVRVWACVYFVSLVNVRLLSDGLSIRCNRCLSFSPFDVKPFYFLGTDWIYLFLTLFCIFWKIKSIVPKMVTNSSILCVYVVASSE